MYTMSSFPNTLYNVHAVTLYIYVTNSFRPRLRIMTPAHCTHEYRDVQPTQIRSAFQAANSDTIMMSDVYKVDFLIIQCKMRNTGNNLREKMSRLMTKPTKWHVRPAKTQISLGIRPVRSVFAVRMKKHWALNYLWAHSEDSDQIRRMPRLIWVFAGHTCQFVGFVMRRLKCEKM